MARRGRHRKGSVDPGNLCNLHAKKQTVWYQSRIKNKKLGSGGNSKEKKRKKRLRVLLFFWVSRKVFFGAKLRLMLIFSLFIYYIFCLIVTRIFENKFQHFFAARCALDCQNHDCRAKTPSAEFILRRSPVTRWKFWQTFIVHTWP